MSGDYRRVSIVALWIFIGIRESFFLSLILKKKTKKVIDQGQPEPESCVGGCAPFCSTGTKEQGEA